MFINFKFSRFWAGVLAEFFVVAAIFALLPTTGRLPAANAYQHYPGAIGPDAFPSPIVPCIPQDFPHELGSVLRNPEFHSLRPYQASPCGDAPRAYYCNNDYTIIEDVSQRYDPAKCWYGSVNQSPLDPNASGSYFCRKDPNTGLSCPDSPTGICPVFIIGGDDGRDYALTLNEAEYPFVGNTEDVFNSQSEEETFDAAGKVNEYVNWYLQGVTDKAEYGIKQSVLPNHLGSYAGPTKKLIPFDILNLRRLEVLHDGVVRERFDLGPIPDASIDPRLLLYDPILQIYYTEASKSHNQIAVCSFHIILFGEVPFPCWNGKGGRANDYNRLDKWWMARGSRAWETYYDSVGNRFQNWTIFNVWKGTTPPFPWQFNDQYLYQKALFEWSGQTCIAFPLLNRYICGAFIEPKKLPSLYEYIPLGNSADKSEGHAVSGVQVKAQGQTQYKLMGYEILHVPKLHYSQTESTVQVSALLNTINTPLECEPLDPTNYTPVPGEGDSCCSEGYTYEYGACVNDKTISACDSVSKLYCKLIEPFDDDKLCDSEAISNACQSASIQAGFATDSPDNIQSLCDLFFAVSALSPSLRDIAIGTCKVALATFFQILPKQNFIGDIACKPGLYCDEGACSNPKQGATLSCDQIGGRGDNYESATCEFVEVESNPGDHLNFRNRPSILYIDNVKTRVDVIECSNSGSIGTWMTDCDGTTHDRCYTEKCLDGNPLDCPNYCLGTLYPGKCTSYPNCSAEITVTIPTTPKIPYINQLWENTVINKNTSFRRIFPRFAENAPVQCIKEIPGTSPVTYITNDDTNLTKISTAGPNYYAGGGPNSQSEGQLFFPHLGTIYEYFLKGIQTALRPRGYGSYIPNGDNCQVVCTEGELPEFPPVNNCGLASGTINGMKIPDTFAQILEAAGSTYNVPPSLIVGVLYGEGVFNGGKFKGEDWSEANVQAWSICAALPGCSDSGSSLINLDVLGYEKIAQEVLPDLQKLDPEKIAVEPCNLIDATYIIAKNLQEDAGGSLDLNGQTCYGITMQSSIPTSCDWEPEQYETAIRVWEFGTKYDDQATCATLEGSCATGGGFAAACPGGDKCEQDGDPGNTSHNACVYEAAHGRL